MTKHKITHFTMASDLKASVVERSNHTLKGRVWRYFTTKNTLTYLDVLQDLVKSYNRSHHSSSIKMTPEDVNEDNAPPDVSEPVQG